jgi:phosphoglycolate phosphatase
MATMHYQAVLFDLDGTQLDTLEDLADSTNAALRRLGFPEHPLAAFRYFVGDGMENLVRRALPSQQQSPPAVAECLTLVRQEYSARWAMKTRPYAGIPELLDGLAARGIAMAVLSNKPHEFTQLCVSRLLPRWQFRHVLGAQPSLPGKPDPAGALTISRQMGLAPKQFIYLGDTNTDMQTAVAAGMLPVGATWGFRTPDELLKFGAKVLLKKPTELLDVLDRAPS